MWVFHMSYLLQAPPWMRYTARYTHIPYNCTAGSTGAIWVKLLAGLTGAMWVKFLLNKTTTTNSTIRESNIFMHYIAIWLVSLAKWSQVIGLQHHPGIEPGSFGSQANPKPLHAAAPHNRFEWNYYNYHYRCMYKRTIHLSRVTSEPFEEPFLFVMGDWVRVDFTSSF